MCSLQCFFLFPFGKRSNFYHRSYWGSRAFPGCVKGGSEVRGEVGEAAKNLPSEICARARAAIAILAQVCLAAPAFCAARAQLCAEYTLLLLLLVPALSAATNENVGRGITCHFKAWRSLSASGDGSSDRARRTSRIHELGGGGGKKAPAGLAFRPAHEMAIYGRLAVIARIDRTVRPWPDRIARHDRSIIRDASLCILSEAAAKTRSDRTVFKVGKSFRAVAQSFLPRYNVTVAAEEWKTIGSGK